MNTYTSILKLSFGVRTTRARFWSLTCSFELSLLFHFIAANATNVAIAAIASIVAVAAIAAIAAIALLQLLQLLQLCF